MLNLLFSESLSLELDASKIRSTRPVSLVSGDEGTVCRFTETKARGLGWETPKRLPRYADEKEFGG